MLNVLDEGPREAPALLLIHSIATHSGMWWPQIPLWSRTFRVLAVDLPGHGASAPEPRLVDAGGYVRLLSRLLDEHGVERCSIVGLSLGGLIGQAFSLAQPDRVHSLVIANSSARLPPEMHERWEGRRLEAVKNGMESQVVSTLDRWFTPEFSARAPLTIERVAAMIRQTSVDGYGSAIAAIRATDTFERLPTLRCPVLVVAGGRDMATPVQALQTIASRVPNAQLEVLDNAAHLSNLAEPIEFSERVGAFLRGAGCARQHAR